MSAPAREYTTHAEVCEFFGIEPSHPHPEWLPYAIQATMIEIVVEGTRRMVFGGSMRCGWCGFGVDIRPGPGTQHPGPEALERCPKCGYAGTSTAAASPLPRNGEP